MTFKPLLALAAVAVVAAAATPAAAQNLISNGDFSLSSLSQSSTFRDGSVTGWNSGINPATGKYGYNMYYTSLNSAKTTGANDSLNGNSNQVLYASTQGSTNGGAFVALDGDTSVNGALTQTVNNLTIGGKYRLSFEWAAAQITTRTGNTFESLQVRFGNETFSTPTVQNVSGGFQGWYNVSYDFTATSTSQVLSFLSIGGPAGLPPVALLDGVSLTAVPEPATWGMMLLGFGMVGAAARSRRRMTAVAA